MGNMTFAIMLGHMAEPPKSLGEGWYSSLISAYNPPDGEDRPDTPSSDGAYNVIGYWIAVGASGKRGVLDMPNAIQLDAIENEEPYAEAIQMARGRWRRFVDWAADNGVVLKRRPRLYLVKTEVA